MLTIRHQTWLEGQTFIQVTLHEPWWGAGQKFGWDGEGFGLSPEAISYALKVDKKIRIVVLKYGRWEISPRMALRRAKEYNSHYIARDGWDLVVIPRFACKKIEKTDVEKRKAEIREMLRDKTKSEAFK